MAQSTRYEAPYAETTPSCDHIPSLSARLQTSVSLLVQVEAVLGSPHGRLGRDPAMFLTQSLRLPELRAEIEFGNHNGGGNGNGRAEEHRATAAIIPRDFKMSIPLQYLAPPARADSDVWALTPTPNLDEPWVEGYPGRLVGEPLSFDQYIPIEVTLDVTFAPEESMNGGGARVDVAGELRFERAMHMRLLFRDPHQSMGPPSESDGKGAVLIAGGSRVPIPRQIVSQLAGSDWWMKVRVVDAEGHVVCVKQPLAGQIRRAS